MESLLPKGVQPALPHALPFRVIMEEYRLRRPHDLLWAAGEVLEKPWTGDSQEGNKTTEEGLRTLLARQERAYRRLQEAGAAIEAGTRQEPTEDLLKKCQDADAPLKAILHKLNASALCLSGGGIRSASFCLGVLEGLARFSRPIKTARNGLMDRLDYFSTVSGGGYIGSWMMSWAFRRAKLPEQTYPHAYAEVIDALAGESPVTGGDPEPRTVRHLRRYTSFLAPELGATLDTSTLLAIVLRNLLVTWVMVVPLLFTVVNGAQWLGLLVQAQEDELHRQKLSLYTCDFLITLLFVMAAAVAAVSLPSHCRKPVQPPLDWVGQVLNKWNALVNGAHIRAFRAKAVGWFFACVLGGTVLLSISRSPLDRMPFGEFWPEFLIGFIAFSFLGASILIAEINRLQLLNRLTARRGIEATFTALIASVIGAASCSGLMLLLRRFAYPFLWNGLHRDLLRHQQFTSRMFVPLAIPGVLSVLLISTTLFCALLGVFEQEEDREWWARCGGGLIGLGICWLVGQFVAFYGFDLQKQMFAGVAGVGLGLVTSLFGYSGVTSAGPRPVKSSQLGSTGKFLEKHHLLLPVLGGIAVALIAIGAVAAAEWLRLLVGQSLPNLRAGSVAFLCFMGSGVLTLIMNIVINVNLFTLQGMYRMRLMRAFLGASNELRHPDPFTRFDWRDTPHLVELAAEPGVPIHIVNTTLNLTGTKDAALRQRKAESFTFTPSTVGGWLVGYAPTGTYGSAKRGLTLATAMSISGSAFNPNMGYHTSALLSLLMTFFNVRLGQWLPNPKWPALKKLSDDAAMEFVSKPGPTFALGPLISEAFGRADDNRKWIELTDGGHFENLGLYEVVLRRCKHIIVADAGADPLCQFEDLGNAIRKIRIDLGIPIAFVTDPKQGIKMEPGRNVSNSYCALARIQYHCVDRKPAGMSDDAFDGWLIYIKAGLTGLEPADVTQYALTHPSFPNEATVNQFFNESQFESYRHLGSFVIDSMIEKREPNAQGSGISDFRITAESFWAQAGKSGAVGSVSSTDHA